MERRSAEPCSIYIDRMYPTDEELDSIYKKYSIVGDCLKEDFFSAINDFIFELGWEMQTYLLSDAIEYAEKIKKHVYMINNTLTKIDRMCYLDYCESHENEFDADGNVLLDESFKYRSLDEVKNKYYDQFKYYSEILEDKKYYYMYSDITDQVARSLFEMSEVKARKNLQETALFSIGASISGYDEFQAIDRNFFIFEYYNTGIKFYEAIESFIKRNKASSEKKGRNDEEYVNKFLISLLLIYREIPSNKQICIKHYMPNEFFIFCNEIVENVYQKFTKYYGKNFKPTFQPGDKRRIRSRIDRFKKKYKL